MRAGEVQRPHPAERGCNGAGNRGVVPREKTRASLEGALKIYSTACFSKLPDIGDNSQIIASFEIDGQGRTSRLFHNVCLGSFDKTRMVGGVMAGYGMAGSIVTPDNQRSHLIELHFVWSNTLARF